MFRVIAQTNDATIPAADMKPGDIGEFVTDGAHQGQVVARFGNGTIRRWVLLSAPEHTWDNTAPGYQVRLFPKGHKLTLEVA